MFSLCPVRQQDRQGRKGYTTGIQVQHEFVVTQAARSIGCLRELQQFFGVGQVIPNRRTDNHRDVMYRFVVRKRSDLLERSFRFSNSTRYIRVSARTSSALRCVSWQWVKASTSHEAALLTFSSAFRQ